MSMTSLTTTKPTIWPQNAATKPQHFNSSNPLNFSGAVSQTTSRIKPRKILEHLDFTAVGTSPVKQIAVIFSSLITWRLLAANERRRTSVSKRWNELRENLMRDLLGFAFWFLGVPVLQRIYLSAVARHNPELKDILIQKMKAEAEQSKGFFNWIKSNNPLSNRYIPSSQQVKDQMHQALMSLEKAGIDSGHPAYLQTRSNYLNLIKHRNFATGIGLGSTILLLGVGINLVNFYLTQKNITKNLKPQNPNSPPLTASNPAAPMARFYPGQYQPLHNQKPVAPINTLTPLNTTATQYNPFQVPQSTSAPMYQPYRTL